MPRHPNTVRSRRHTIEPLESRVLLAADWQNPIEPLDVDGSSGTTSPLDALLVINELTSPSISEPGTGRLPDVASAPPPFLDVDGNGLVSPHDALLVVNALPAASDDPTTGSVDPPGTDSVIVGTVAAQHQGVAHDTLVNTTTRKVQRDVAVASDGDGNSIFVWASKRQDGSSWGIFGQRYDQNGSKTGGEFQINQTTRHAQRQPTVAMWEDGSFVVGWSSLGQDGAGWGVFGRFFAPDGTPQGNEFRVNTHTRGNQWRPSVAVMDAGDAIEGDDQAAYFAWAGRGPGDHKGVFWTSVEVGANVPAGDSLANATTRALQTNPSIDVSDGGLVAIAWQGRGSGDRRGIFMDLFGPNRNSLLGETLVNNPTHSAERTPSLAFAPRGSLAGDQLGIAWQTRAGEPGSGVRARNYSIMPRLDSGGLFDVTSGREIQVNETTRGAQKQPALAYLNDSSFLVAWFGRGPGDHKGVFSRQFDSNGSPLHNEYLVNETTKAIQSRPAATAANDGYIIGWDGKGPADRRGIFTRFVNTAISAPFLLDPIPDMTLDEGDTLDVVATVTDLNGQDNEVRFSFGNNVPDGATINPITGRILWMTDEADGPGVYPFVVVATSVNGDGFSDDQSFMVTVNEVDNGISIEPIADQVMIAGEVRQIPVVVNDPDGDSFTTSASLTDGAPLPSWLTYDPATLTFTAMPQASDVGTISVTVTATDSGGATAAETFMITVRVADTGFEFGVPAQIATVDQLFSIDLDDFVTLTGTVDPGTITYTVNQTNGNPLPSWLSLNATTNVLSGTPTENDVADLSLRAVATGSNTGSLPDDFFLFVTESNLAPTIHDQTFRVASDAPNGTTVGTVIGSDPNAGDELTYEILAGNDAGAFSISTAGVISVADSAALPMMTILTVGVTDSGQPQLSGMGSVTIFATNVPALAGYSLRAFDTEGEEIGSLTPGEMFELRMFATDLRPGLSASEGGVFSAFADMIFSSSLVSAIGPVQVAMLYGAAQSGSLAAPGLLDEVGGVDGINPLGPQPQEVARVPMQAGTFTGVARFGTDFADQLVQRPTLLFGTSEPVTQGLIDFGTLALTIDVPVFPTLTAPQPGTTQRPSMALGEQTTTATVDAGVVQLPRALTDVTPRSRLSTPPMDTGADHDDDEPTSTDLVFAMLGGGLG